MIPVNEVYSTFFERGERGSVAVLYKLWFDDTADQNKEKFVMAAGLIGRHKDWTDFQRRWKSALRTPPRIEWFHSKEWRRLDGQFRQFRDPIKYPKPLGGNAANAKRQSLKAVIESSRVAGIAVSMLIEDFNRVRAADPVAAEFFRPDPYEGALQAVVYESAMMVRRLSQEEGRGDDGHCIGFVSDDSNRAPTYSAVYADFKAKNPDIARIMRGLAHLDDKKWAALQAADLVAHVCNQVAKEVVKVPAADRLMLESLPELQGKIWKIAHVDQWYLCHILEVLRGVSLFEKLGIEPRHYKSDYELEHD